MQSFQISITPSRRAAARHVSDVRRALQKALAEEAAKRGLTQSDIARTIGVHRSVINRELRGHKDITLGRVGELAFALGRVPEFSLPNQNTQPITANVNPESVISAGGFIANSPNPHAITVKTTAAK